MNYAETNLPKEEEQAFRKPLNVQSLKFFIVAAYPRMDRRKCTDSQVKDVVGVTNCEGVSRLSEAEGDGRAAEMKGGDRDQEQGFEPWQCCRYRSRVMK